MRHPASAWSNAAALNCPRTVGEPKWCRQPHILWPSWLPTSYAVIVLSIFTDHFLIQFLTIATCSVHFSSKCEHHARKLLYRDVFNSPWNAPHNRLPENSGRWRSERLSRNSMLFRDNRCTSFFQFYIVSPQFR